MEIKHDVTIKTWDGTWTYHPKVMVTPESVEDMVEIMVDEVRFPSPVRPAGSMHSTARMNGDDGGTMVDMKGMNRILHFTDDTVTVEAGVTHIVLANALKDRGLQPYVTTEIGNVTLGAMATAATKDLSFPGGFGQVSSYVTTVRLVTPDGKLREITERDNPEEMQIIRSSYGLLGIVYEVTIKVKTTTALAVRHYSLSLENFRRYFPVYKARGYRRDVLHLPLCEARAGGAPQGEPRPPAHLAPALDLSQPLLAQIRPRRHAMDRAKHQEPEAPRARRQVALLPASPGARADRAQRPHLAARADHLLSARAR